MHFSTTVLFSFSLAIATGVFADTDSQTSQLGLKTKPAKISKRAVPSLLDTRETCSGTCKTCFGPTSTDCPNSSILCYDTAKGDAASQCSGSSGGGTPSTPTRSASPGATGTTDTCYQKGASCQSCFGPGSVNCPAGTYYDCYEPAQNSEAVGCNKAGSGGGAPASSAASGSAPPAPSSTNSCETQYGAGNVLCGQASCYNPGDGEVCCGDGSHCLAGTQCVLRGSVYKCSSAGSSGSLTSDTTATRTSSAGIVNTTGTGIGVIVGASSDSSTTTSAARVTRSTSSHASSASTETAAPTGSSTSSSGTSGAAPLFLGKGTGAVGALAVAGLLALMGLL